jgi:His-Xaa-Ser system protein HxsD
MSNDQTINIVFNTKLYPADAILTSCHKFLARCFVRLDYAGDSDKDIKVTLKPRENIAPDGLEDEFRDELLNNTMKVKVLKGTARIRDQIFHIVFNPERLDALGGQLLSELGTKGDPGALKLSARLEKLLEEIESEDSQDYEDDPLGIAIPWEEKHGMPKDLLHPVDQLKKQAEKNLINIDMVKNIVDS